MLKTYKIAQGSQYQLMLLQAGLKENKRNVTDVEDNTIFTSVNTGRLYVAIAARKAILQRNVTSIENLVHRNHHFLRPHII